MTVPGVATVVEPVPVPCAGPAAGSAAALTTTAASTDPRSAPEVDFGGTRLRLLPERAAWVEDLGLLLVADMHLGKPQAFRRLGVPVPEGSTDDDLQRLSRLLATTTARHLVFLGDLLHARASRAPGLLSAVAGWRSRHAEVAMTLVRGNHDARSGDPPVGWGVSLVDEPWGLGPLALCHHPQEVPGRAVVAGHVHPGVVLGSAADRLRLPCFHVGPRCTVLPAFGSFTGLNLVQPGPHDRLWAVADGRVWALPAPAVRRVRRARASREVQATPG